MDLTIKFKNCDPIAHEIVFPEDIEKTLVNCFRFALKSYLYHKDLNLYTFFPHSGLSSNTLTRQLGVSTSSNKVINYNTAIKACKYFDVEFDFLYLIAEQLVKNPQYNAMSFSGKKSNRVTFFKAYKFSYRN